MALGATDVTSLSADDRTEVEVRRLRIHRDSLREERTELGRRLEALDREAGAYDSMIATLVELRPDLASKSDTRHVLPVERTADLSRELVAILRDESGQWLSVSEIAVQFAQRRSLTSSDRLEKQIRNGLRYIATRSSEVESERTVDRPLSYRFRAPLKPR